jgi:hypothetical protein
MEGLAAMGNLYALVLGWNRYDRLPRLAYARSDALRVGRWLRKHCKPGYRKVLPRVGIDRDVRSRVDYFDLIATKSNLLNELKQFGSISSDVSADDSVLIYLSAHGSMNAVCPSDYSRDSPDSSLPIEMISAMIDGSSLGRAGMKLVILDTCRKDDESSVARAREVCRPDEILASVPLIKDVTAVLPNGGEANAQPLVAANSQWSVLAGTSRGAVAHENSRIKHGWFTWVLLRYLRELRLKKEVICVNNEFANGLAEYMSDSENYYRSGVKQVYYGGQAGAQRPEFSGQREFLLRCRLLRKQVRAIDPSVVKPISSPTSSMYPAVPVQRRSNIAIRMIEGLSDRCLSRLVAITGWSVLDQALVIDAAGQQLTAPWHVPSAISEAPDNRFLVLWNQGLDGGSGEIFLTYATARSFPSAAARLWRSEGISFDGHATLTWRQHQIPHFELSIVPSRPNGPCRLRLFGRRSEEHRARITCVLRVKIGSRGVSLRRAEIV